MNVLQQTIADRRQVRKYSIRIADILDIVDNLPPADILKHAGQVEPQELKAGLAT